MRNLTVVVAWHGGSPKVSTSYTDPRGSTLSPENPRRQALTGSRFSLPMPIFSKADAKMISAELPLSTRTLWIVLLATMAFVVDKDPVDHFIGYYGFYHKWVVMGMLETFHVEI